LNFSSEGNLIKVFKDAQVTFQTERVDNVYMLQNLKVTGGGLQLISALRSEVVEQSETMMVLSSDIQFYPEGKLKLGGIDVQYGSPDHYSCIGTNSHKSRMDPGDY